MKSELRRTLLLGAVIVFMGCVRAVSLPATDTRPKIDAGSDVLGPDVLGPDSQARDTLARDTLARDSLARDTLARDSLARDTLARDSLARDSLARDTLARDSLPACVDPCDDHDPCTKNDSCTGGKCRGVAYTCHDGDQCTTDQCQGDGTCKFAPIDPCDAGYALSYEQPSGSITSTSNRVKLYKLTKTSTAWKISSLVDMGSFKSAPAWWDFWYDSTNPPGHCHDRYALYAGTPYEGITERYFVGSSKADLNARLQARLTEKYTLRAGANYAGGDLCKSGNFWTTMKVTAAGITHIQAELAKY